MSTKIFSEILERNSDARNSIDAINSGRMFLTAISILFRPYIHSLHFTQKIEIQFPTILFSTTFQSKRNFHFAPAKFVAQQREKEKFISNIESTTFETFSI